MIEDVCPSWGLKFCKEPIRTMTHPYPSHVFIMAHLLCISLHIHSQIKTWPAVYSWPSRPSHPSHLHGGCMKKLERYEENQKRIVNLSYRAPQKIETRFTPPFQCNFTFLLFWRLPARRQERHMFTTRLPRDFSRVAHHDVPAGKAVWHPGRVSQQHGAGFSWIFAWGKG